MMSQLLGGFGSSLGLDPYQYQRLLQQQNVYSQQQQCVPYVPVSEPYNNPLLLLED